MTKIAFIGTGNMGLPMALNLIKAEHVVCGYDLNTVAVEKLEGTTERAAWQKSNFIICRLAGWSGRV